MRRFELILVFAALFAVAWPAVFGVRTRRGIIALLLVAAFIAHWQIEGLRWQMIPIYLVSVGLVVGDLIVVERDLNWTRRLARGIFGVGGILLLVLLPLALPIPTLPVPSGPEPVGTISFELVDEDREEVYGSRAGEPRRFMAQVWYPGRPVEGVAPTLWNDDWDVVMPELARTAGLPGWFFNHTRYTSSNSSPSLPLSDGTFPVIVFSHGWTGFRASVINQIESLVSNGYMVVAIDHTYGAVATRFPDGEVVTFDPMALPEAEAVSEDAYSDASTQLLEVFADDIVTVIDLLESGDEGPFGSLAESADLTRIGVYGHSAGGGAAVMVCLTDERCDAVLGMDPWVEPIPDRTISESATRPAMFMRSDEWRLTENDAVLRGIAERSLAETYWIGVEGAHHSDFLVTPLFSPVGNQLGFKGPIPAGTVVSIIDRYLLGFFDVFLLGTGSAAIDTASFEEVSVELIQPE